MAGGDCGPKSPYDCSNKECRRRDFVATLRDSVAKHGCKRLILEDPDVGHYYHCCVVNPRTAEFFDGDECGTDEDMPMPYKLIGFVHEYGDKISVTAEQFAENPELCFEMYSIVERKDLKEENTPLFGPFRCAYAEEVEREATEDDIRKVQEQLSKCSNDPDLQIVLGL
jgi:hypothetical protein